MEQKKHDGGNWDNVWSQETTSKHLVFLRKIGYIYIDLSGLLSKFLTNYIQKDKEYSIIELGCGGSSYLPYLQKRYSKLKIYGIDKSMEGCQSTFKGLQTSYDVVCGDIIKSPLKSQQFDIVFSVGLIEHFDDPYEIIQRHIDLLKPGGLIICLVPNVIGLQGKFFSLKIWKSKHSISKDSKNFIWGMKRIFPYDLDKWFTKSGLHNITVGPIGGIYPFLMMESYHPDSELITQKLAFIVYRYFLFLPCIAINVPFLFRLNSNMFSPFLIASGIKK